MKRTLFSAFAGAGIGMLAATAIGAMTRATSTPDGLAIILFIGVFLAGTCAIAGAIVGGVADLIEFFKKKEEARQIQERRTS
jgi:hypothetical protein